MRNEPLFHLDHVGLAPGLGFVDVAAVPSVQEQSVALPHFDVHFGDLALRTEYKTLDKIVKRVHGRVTKVVAVEDD
jgi:hypothetical protein